VEPSLNSGRGQKPGTRGYRLGWLLYLASGRQNGRAGTESGCVRVWSVRKYIYIQFVRGSSGYGGVCRMWATGGRNSDVTSAKPPVHFTLHLLAGPAGGPNNGIRSGLGGVDRIEDFLTESINSRIVRGSPWRGSDDNIGRGGHSPGDRISSRGPPPGGHINHLPCLRVNDFNRL
jgi:hypothetical protein